jgi:hypothetical protein
VNIERSSAATSVIDVLDRVLDKGIVMDAWLRVSVLGIDLVTVEARVVVASIETFPMPSELCASLDGFVVSTSRSAPLRATSDQLLKLSATLRTHSRSLRDVCFRLRPKVRAPILRCGDLCS